MRIGDRNGKTRFVDIIAYQEWNKRGSPEPNDNRSGEKSSDTPENGVSENLFFQPHYGLRRELSVDLPSELSSPSLTFGYTCSNIQTIRALQDELELTSFLTPEVNHRGRAYGLVMQHKSGWKIS
jgi:hypothetical protein